MSFSFAEFTEKSQKALDHFKHTLTSLRTGRASADMLDSVTVDAYGSKMRLVEVASVSVPDATLITVSPWDKSLLKQVEEAIATSDLNLNPVVDGQIIRIAVAPLTKEKREEMVKELHKRAEEGRVLLRGVRTDIKKDIEQQEGKDGISEDAIAFDLQELEKKHKAFLEELDSIVERKEKELLTI